MRALEGHCVSSKSPPRVLDQNNGVVGGTEEFCPPGKLIIFFKRQTEKMELVTRLAHNHQTRETLTESHGQELQTDTESWKSSSGYRLVITVPAGFSGQFSSTGFAKPKVLSIFWSSKNLGFLVAEPKKVSNPKVAKPKVVKPSGH